MFAAVATRTPPDLSQTPWPQVRAAASEHDLELATLDALECADPHDVYLISDSWDSRLARWAGRGATPAVLLSFEPPVVAWQLYYNLERISARFPHTFLYEGARERVAPVTWFHPLNVPVPCPPLRPTGLPWSARGFLVAVNDNEAPPRRVSIPRMIAGLRYRPIAHERYLARLRAFEAFATRDDFDLYGERWGRRESSVPPELHAAVVRAYQGTIDDRPGLLAKYRFALVYESTRFPGYISDLILDCFFARCVPIYSGAPDVAQYIPPSAFIDVRQFQSFPELERFLVRTTEDDARRYVDAAHAFLISSAFEAWCADRFARDLVEALVHIRTAASTSGV